MISSHNPRMKAGRWLLAAQAVGLVAFLLVSVLATSAHFAHIVARSILLGLQASLLFQLQTGVSREHAKDSSLWRMLAVAIVLWMVASASELISLLPGGEAVPVPALSHLMMLAGVFAATTGVGLYPVSEGEQIGRLRDLLDVALLLIGSLSFFWMAVIRPVIDTGIGSAIAIAWLAVGPAFDLAVSLLLFRLILLASSFAERSMLLALMLAFLLRLPSDLAQSYSQVMTDVALAPIWQAGWLLTPVVLTVAAYMRPGSAGTRPGSIGWAGRRSRLAGRVESILPVALVIILAGLTLVEWWLIGNIDGYGLATTGIMLFLLVARQGVIAGQAEIRLHAALLQAAADLAFVCDIDGQLVLTNPAMEAATGLGTGKERPGRLQDLMGEAEAMQALEQAIDGGWTGEVVFHGQHGILPVDLSLRPLIDERQGEPLVAGTAHDLSELKARESELEGALAEVALAREQLQTLNASLESKVESRTEELAETIDRLETMNEELQQLDLLKSEFVTLVSHELRGPLTNIRSGVELALRRAEQVPGSIQETLQLVSAETERLTNFVEIILDLSALEAGRFPLQIERTPLPVIARTVASRIPADSGGGRIELPLDDSLPQVEADERSLMSVLFHLLDNALKYAPAGPVTVSAEPDHGFLRVSVADHGPGIAPQDRQAVFDQFRRLDSSDSRNVYGHGLGLYLSRRLVEAMGGRIEAGESASGGAEIAFWLPIAEP